MASTWARVGDRVRDRVSVRVGVRVRVRVRIRIRVGVRVRVRVRVRGPRPRGGTRRRRPRTLGRGSRTWGEGEG